MPLLGAAPLKRNSQVFDIQLLELYSSFKAPSWSLVFLAGLPEIHKSMPLPLGTLIVPSGLVPSQWPMRPELSLTSMFHFHVACWGRARPLDAIIGKAIVSCARQR